MSDLTSGSTPRPTRDRCLALLKQYWGYEGFRGIQEDIIRSVLQGRDTLGLMPTGGGKSITFQVPALAMEGLCLVVTPLIALMKDQVHQLRRRGIKATAVYSGMDRQEVAVALENCIFGNYKLLYISPERIDTQLFRAKLRHIKVSMVAVDESHCISQWGYDFRPAYLKIAELRDLVPSGVPLLALTATATPRVVADIQEKLHFRQENVFRMSFARANLAYVVRPTEDKDKELLHILQHTTGSAIVYVRNRMATRDIASALAKAGLSATFYHAGLDHAVRDRRQRQWTAGHVRVIVATNAFGMGIDKPDVRLVVHMDLPDSLEAYFQEAGRAGRDGQLAYAVLLYQPTDRSRLLRRIADQFPERDYIKKVYEDMQFYYQMAMGDGLGCIRPFDLDDFCHKFRHFPTRVNSALRILTLSEYLEYVEEPESASRLMFTVRRDELYHIHALGEPSDRLIRTVLRLYTGLFAEYAFINERAIAQHSGLSADEVYLLLLNLSRLRIVHYVPQSRLPRIIYRRQRVELEAINIPAAVYEGRLERYRERVHAMVDYAANTTTCRSQLLLHYFGENATCNCGICDTCRRLKASVKQPTLQAGGSPEADLNPEGLLSASALSERVLSLLAKGPINPNDLALQLSAGQEAIAAVLNQLLDQGQAQMVNGMLSLFQTSGPANP